MHLFLKAALAGLCLCVADDVRAQVRRCVSPEGATIYTDRRCDDIGAIEQAPSAALPGRALLRTGCARTLQDLQFEVTMAITSGDANRLLGVYHWAGMSSAQAYAVVPRLAAIAQRPLVDVVPVMPRGPDGSDGDYYPQTTVSQAPVALRIEQTLANGSTPARAVFGLHRYFGCWWLRG